MGLYGRARPKLDETVCGWHEKNRQRNDAGRPSPPATRPWSHISVPHATSAVAQISAGPPRVDLEGFESTIS